MTNIQVLVVLLISSLFSYGQNTPVVEPAFDLSSYFSNIRDFTLSSTGDEAYITVQSSLGEISVLVELEKSGDEWMPKRILPFSGKYKDLEPFLSRDNLRLYFASNRPKPDSTNVSDDFDIWYVERAEVNDSWGEPINPGEPINSEYDEFYPSVSQKNNMYFTSDRPSSKGKDDIFCSDWKNNEYTEPFSLDESINTTGYEFNAYVAFDESYIIFSGYNRDDGFGSGDLYISYRDENGKWDKAMNLGKEFNSKYMDYCPFVDYHSKTLYFTSKRNSFKEVNNFQSLEDLVEEIHKNENSISAIYKVSIDDGQLPGN